MEELEIKFDEWMPLRSGGVGHNRRHPDMPPIAHVHPGDAEVGQL